MRFREMELRARARPGGAQEIGGTSMARFVSTFGYLSLLFLATGHGASLAQERHDFETAGKATETCREQALQAYANLPLAFVENRGQTDARVRYHAPGSRCAIYLTPEEVVLSFAKGSEAANVALRL